MKPPFSYFGGKTTLAERIADLLPAHRHYVEPFAGSLAVLLAKPPSKLETVNDIDGDLVLFWRVLRDRTDELTRAAALTPHSRAEHVASFVDTDDELERARRVWVRLAQGRNGKLHQTGWRYFSKPDGTNSSMPSYLAAYVDRMPPAAARLKDVSLECRPALDLIRTYGQHPEVCLYVDPPYAGETRPRSFGVYRNDMRSAADHAELAKALHDCEASVVLSGYPGALYSDLYADWCSVEFDAFTGQGTAGTGHRTEALWSNRDLGGVHLFSGIVG